MSHTSDERGSQFLFVDTKLAFTLELFRLLSLLVLLERGSELLLEHSQEVTLQWLASLAVLNVVRYAQKKVSPNRESSDKFIDKNYEKIKELTWLFFFAVLAFTLTVKLSQVAQNQGEQKPLILPSQLTQIAEEFELIL